MPSFCVNPQDIHSQTHRRWAVVKRGPPQSSFYQAVSNCSSDSVPRQSDDASSGVFYQPNSKLKVEMEIFGDLSAFCQSPRMGTGKRLQNCVDELNTPVFELKAPFDYDRRLYETPGLLDIVTSTEDPFNFKIKSELSEVDNVNIGNNIIYTKDGVTFKNGESRDIANASVSSMNTDISVDNCVVIDNPNIDTTNSSMLFSPSNSDSGDIYSYSATVTPVCEEVVEDEDEEEHLATVNNCSDILMSHNGTDYYIDNQSNIYETIVTSPFSDVATLGQYAELQNANYETPENSRTGSEFSEQSSPEVVLNIIEKPSLNLKLEINDKFDATDAIDTPGVIEALNSIETEKEFNILSFINDEEISTASKGLPTINIPITNTPPVYDTQQDVFTFAKTDRKRRRNDDDDEADEDYEPPTKKKIAIAIPRPQHRPRVASDSESDEEFIPPTRGRGRPPKRKVSISSEDCNDPDSFKYREMRDKNNEASRKSRFKRKIKEMTLEKEADLLYEKNTKLKAQVEELDRTVSNFRNNLMQILLKK